jgi:hypothetical protein
LNIEFEEGHEKGLSFQCPIKLELDYVDRKIIHFNPFFLE